MNVRLHIQADERLRRKMIIHPEVAEELGIQIKQHSILRFGTNTSTIMLELNSELQKENCILSLDCIKELQLPVIPVYELQVSSNVIEIGPFVGILAAKTNKKLSGKLTKLLNYVHYYERFKGAVLVFSLEGINKNENKIFGYLYNPNSQNWEEGVYPIPKSIYRRVTMKRPWREYFEKQIGPQFFNYKNFSKWDLYLLLEGFDHISKHLPFTTLYRNPTDVIAFLKAEKSAFLKPIAGLKGKNIKEVTLNKNGYNVCYREGDQNISIKMNENELIQFLDKNVTPKKYIIQQKLHLVFQDNRVVDFRVFITKDQTGRWKCLGWIGRRGVPSSIVSNRSSGGLVEKGDDTLRNIIRENDEDIKNMRERVFEIACEACKCFDKKDLNFGYFAIDIGIDSLQNIWILEMNHRSPNDGLPLYVDDQELFKQIKLSNMLYLKNLAGFPEEI